MRGENETNALHLWLIAHLLKQTAVRPFQAEEKNIFLARVARSKTVKDGLRQRCSKGGQTRCIINTRV
jgi:hypothetical protein